MYEILFQDEINRVYDVSKVFLKFLGEDVTLAEQG
ncbi:hypothetical protein QF049_001357 [Paenibacillus sp. W4I10]|nr:hypothetical protein [Paenibacillus sp. W4I10]